MSVQKFDLFDRIAIFSTQDKDTRDAFVATVFDLAMTEGPNRVLEVYNALRTNNDLKINMARVNNWPEIYKIISASLRVKK